MFFCYNRFQSILVLPRQPKPRNFMYDNLAGEHYTHQEMRASIYIYRPMREDLAHTYSKVPGTNYTVYNWKTRFYNGPSRSSIGPTQTQTGALIAVCQAACNSDQSSNCQSYYKYNHRLYTYIRPISHTHTHTQALPAHGFALACNCKWLSAVQLMTQELRLHHYNAEFAIKVGL